MSNNIIPFDSFGAQPLIVDGKPEMVVNVAGVAEMVRKSPLGSADALAALKERLSPKVFALVESEVAA